MWQGPRHHHQSQQKCLDHQQQTLPHTLACHRQFSNGSSEASSSSSLHGHHQPLLHFPPPPNYPPPHPVDRMSEDFLNLPGPSSQPDPAWVGPGPNDYSYAYYEPGPPTRHTNIPPCRYPGGGTGSIRRGGFREGSYRSKHTYLTRYGTEENIYEEITDGTRARMRSSQQSIFSLNQRYVEEEVRRVQSGHRRVLGELNLSVEAMLMPANNSREGSEDNDRDDEVHDQLADLLTIGPTDDLLSPVPMVDLDSGFSGSSSGASYRSAAGSLRRGPEKKSIQTATTSNAAKTSSPSSNEPSPSKSFWSKKAWKKLGLSNISLNKSNKGKKSWLWPW